jgi:hypothetical protein
MTTVPNCDFSESGVCRRCGFTVAILPNLRNCVPLDVIEQQNAAYNLVEISALHAQARPGLGDMVAAGLSAIGITKDRVSALAGGDCGCSKRQEQLNELGRRIGIG